MASQEEVQNPVCNMRAKFEDKQIYTITSYDLLIPTKHINTETWGVAMSETQSLDYDIYTSIEFDDNNFVLRLSKRLIKYLVKEYNVKNIDDIIGLNIEFSIYSENKIQIDNNFVIPIDTRHNYISHDEFMLEANNSINYKNCLNNKKEHIYNYNICGEVIVKEVKTVEKENKYITTLTVTNAKTDYMYEFDLEYPLLYDEENKVINFINEKGYGSTDGLIDEKITVDWAYRYDDCEIISRCGSMAIINKNENLNKYNNKNSNFIKSIKNLFIGFNIFILASIVITYSYGAMNLFSLFLGYYIILTVVIMFTHIIFKIYL